MTINPDAFKGDSDCPSEKSILRAELSTLRARIADLEAAGDGFIDKFDIDRDSVKCSYCGYVQPIRETKYIHSPDCPVTLWQKVRQG